MHICILDGQTLNPGDLNWDGLKSFGTLDIYERSPLEEIVKRSKDADVVIVNKVKLNGSHFDELPKLKLICISATGYDNVDIQAAKERNIAVCNVSGYSTSGVAQHVFAMLLSWLNRPVEHDATVKEGQWVNSPDFSYTLLPIEELAGKTFGVFGFGQIGQRVASIAKAFGMRVLAVNKYPDRVQMDGVEFVDKETLARSSDYLSLHVPFNESTNAMVNSDFVQMMPDHAILINTGRGGLIQEEQLATALNQGQLAAALLDVLSTEPPQKNNPLLSAKNCLINPHIAWASVQSRQRLLAGIEGNIKDYLSGKETNRIV